MRFNAVAGCCAAYNIANVGFAHGHSRARNQEEFELRFRGKHFARMNFVITNYQQDVERQYLKTMGFKEVQASDLVMHVISSTDLRNYLTSREVHLQEYLKSKEKEKPVVPVKTSAFGARPLNIYMGLVTAVQVQNLRPRNFTNSIDQCREWRETLQRHYGVVIPLNRWTQNDVPSVRRRVYNDLYRLRRGF